MVSTSSFFVESKRESLLLVSPAPLHELRTLQSLDRQPLTTATTLALFPYSLAPQEKWKGIPRKTAGLGAKGPRERHPSCAGHWPNQGHTESVLEPSYHFS